MSFKLNRFLGLVGKSTMPRTRTKRQALAEILELLRGANSFESFVESKRFAKIDINALTDDQVRALFTQCKELVKQYKHERVRKGS